MTPGTAANPMNATNNPTMTSDKGTFGNLKVEMDGAPRSGAPPPSHANSSYDGTEPK